MVPSDNLAAAIVTAAGSGTRLGAGIPKALVPLAGVPILSYAVAGMALAGITPIIVTAPQTYLGQFRAALTPDQLSQAARIAWPEYLPMAFESDQIRVLAGGNSRQASVAAGLAELTQLLPSQVVLVHDAARPLTPPELIRRLAAAVSSAYPAVIPGLAVADTLKRVSPEGIVTETVDREQLRAIQTPQAFTIEVLRRAHHEGAARASNESCAATDDAALVEALNIPIQLLPGDSSAAKITTAQDLTTAQLRLSTLG